MLRRAASFLLLTLLVGSPASGQEWARKMFQQNQHDFGTVARGAKAEYEFVLSNIYLEDVHIASVRSSCGCTAPRIKKAWLKTYEQGAIVAAFNTRAFLGRRGATLTVTIDKPFYAEIQLQVTGYIRSDLVFNPSSVQLGSIDHGNGVDRRVTIDYSGRRNWKILDVTSSNPHISGEIVETRRVGGRVKYGLRVHLDKDAPVGRVSDHLMLVTNEQGRRQVPILVEGKVLAAVSVSPASLFMGVVKPGKAVTKKLVVRGKKPFRILAITCDDESFQFGTPTDQQPKVLHVIPVTFVAHEGAGKVTRTIRIETDLGEMTPELAAYAVVSPP